MQQVRLPRDAHNGLRDHHERYDGSGYPSGLKGMEISLGGRVIAVADVFDALKSDRPYRKGLSATEVCNFMLEHAGTHFDPSIVEILLELKAPPGWVPAPKTRSAAVNF